MAVDSYGYPYLVCKVNLTSSDDVFIRKYESTGGVIWEQTFLGPWDDDGIAIAVDGNNNSYICGTKISSSGGMNDLLLLALNASGTTLWNWTWGGPKNELGNDIAVGTDGFLYICGDLYSWRTSGNSDAFLLKFHTLGEYIPETPCWLWVVITVVVAPAAVAVAILAWYVTQKPRSSKR